MKKLSVSLFAVLAIAFAVFSAFTTAKTSKVFLSGFYANQNGSTSSADGINADRTTSLQAKDDETETNVSSLIGSGNTYANLSEFAADNCDNTTTVVCAVQIVNDQVIDFKNGIYQQ